MTFGILGMDTHSAKRPAPRMCCSSFVASTVASR